MNENINVWNGRCWKVVNFSLPANFIIFLGRFFHRTVVFNLLNVVSRSFCWAPFLKLDFIWFVTYFVRFCHWRTCLFTSAVLPQLAV